MFLFSINFIFFIFYILFSFSCIYFIFYILFSLATSRKRYQSVVIFVMSVFIFLSISLHHYLSSSGWNNHLIVCHQSCDRCSKFLIKRDFSAVRKCMLLLPANKSHIYSCRRPQEGAKGEEMFTEDFVKTKVHGAALFKLRYACSI